MKKILKFSAIICALAMALSMGFTTAFAAARTETVLEDSFGSKTYEGKIDTSKWYATFSSDETIKQKDMVENQTLRFIKGQSNGEQIQYGTINKIQNITKVEYSFMIPEDAGVNTWFAVSFAGQIDPTKAGCHIYDTKLKFGPGIGEIGNIFGKWIKVTIIPTSDTAVTVNFAEIGGNEKTHVAYIDGFRFSAIESDTRLSDAEKAQAVEKKIQDEGWSYKNAHIIWGSEGFGHGICLDDIKIYTQKEGEEEKLTCENTFDSLILDGKTGDFKAYECGKKASTALEIAEDNKLLFEKTKKGDRITSFAYIEADESPADFVKCLDVSFFVRIEENSSDAIAFAFALEDEYVDPTQNGYLYVIKEDSVGVATGHFEKYVNGKKVEGQTPHVLEKVAMKNGAKIAIEIYKNGKAVVKHNDTVVSEDFIVDAYAGCFGFYSPKDNDGTVYVDNIWVSSTSYEVPETKSVTHNFDNDFIGNEGFEDFYMKSIGGDMRIEDGSLVWDYCSDFSYFGSAYKYDGFILDYQIKSIFVSDQYPGDAGYNNGTYPSTWMGLDIGRSNVDRNKYGSYLTILFTINPYASEEWITPSLYIDREQSILTYESLKFVKYSNIPASLLRAIHYDNINKNEDQIKAEDALCVRWVSDTETKSIRLYLKRFGDAEYTLYYEVFVDATGYVALTTTGFTTLKIDNFSMSNTSPIYTIANNEKPQTIYPDPIVEYIYKPDVEGNWDAEVKMNLGGKLSWLWLVGGIVVGLLGLGAGFLMLQKAKKLAQPVKEPVAENNESGGDL